MRHALTALALILTGAACSPAADPEPFSPETGGLLACEAEDSTNCYWDAAGRGNGQGRSFVNLDGKVLYLDTWVRFRDINGHEVCYAKVGPTTTIRCLDGYETTS